MSAPDFDVEPITAWKKSSQGGAVILDVREAEEVEQVSVFGALHIPLGELVARRRELPSETDLLILCHSGQRSGMATDFLRQSGYPRAWNIRGGIVAWWKSGLPLIENWSADDAG
jgi:rhodanese-related sulfurtransferase